MEVAGVTLSVWPTKAPGFQVKVKAPFALKVLEFPLQITVGELFAVIVGFAFTITLTVAEFEHPLIFVPLTV